jgi:hypothetical protein
MARLHTHSSKKKTSPLFHLPLLYQDIAIPGFATHNATLESWMELITKEDFDRATALLFPRSTATVMVSPHTVTHRQSEATTSSP